MNDVILTHKHDASRCGTVKFSQQLAARLGIPCEPIDRRPFREPLFSIQPDTHSDTLDWPEVAAWFGTYDLFLHSGVGGAFAATVQKARKVYAANKEIAQGLKRLGRIDVIDAWAPATILGKHSRGAVKILTFGMSHKLQTSRYEALKTELDAADEDYTISLSMGLHDGTTLEQADSVVSQMRALFGERFRYLGFLSDDALSKELKDCDRVALFYETAARANNTTLWAALDAGKQVYTNTDDLSPDLDASKYTWNKLEQLIRA